MDLFYKLRNSPSRILKKQNLAIAIHLNIHLKRRALTYQGISNESILYLFTLGFVANLADAVHNIYKLNTKHKPDIVVEWLNNP